MSVLYQGMVQWRGENINDTMGQNEDGMNAERDGSGAGVSNGGETSGVL